MPYSGSSPTPIIPHVYCSCETKVVYEQDGSVFMVWTSVLFWRHEWDHFNSFLSYTLSTNKKVGLLRPKSREILQNRKISGATAATNCFTTEANFFAKTSSRKVAPTYSEEMNNRDVHIKTTSTKVRINGKFLQIVNKSKDSFRSFFVKCYHNYYKILLIIGTLDRLLG